jgi:hypothetical protein
MDKTIEELIKLIREQSYETCTSFTLFVNCEGAQVTINHITPKDLKKQGISTRNIKGDFINWFLLCSGGVKYPPPSEIKKKGKEMRCQICNSELTTGDINGKDSIIVALKVKN